MRVNGRWYRAVWMEGNVVCMIDQNKLPYEFEVFKCKNHKDTCAAIENMTTRGAGSIGAAAGFAMAQAIMEASESPIENYIIEAKNRIEATRPTAQNLFYAVERVYKAYLVSSEFALQEAQKIADECAEDGRLIGEFGNTLIKSDMRILTHCNAGWLALQDYGSALSPIYAANESGKNPFVWVDETRPRNQGARLTAWELYHNDIKHKIISDNAAAYLMKNKEIDIVITGADRIAANGDTANKIGTLSRAIASKYFGIPFYIAAPLSTFDVSLEKGEDINIELRDQNEVRMLKGKDINGNWHEIYTAHSNSETYNPAFDITPANLITGIITNKGIIKANKTEIKSLIKHGL
jgi:methylthioribose-1-phosphate isomerase